MQATNASIFLFYNRLKLVLFKNLVQEFVFNRLQIHIPVAEAVLVVLVLLKDLKPAE